MDAWGFAVVAPVLVAEGRLVRGRGVPPSPGSGAFCMDDGSGGSGSAELLPLACDWFLGLPVLVRLGVTLGSAFGSVLFLRQSSHFGRNDFVVPSESSTS